MVNGKYDFTFPPDEAQAPLFRMLGTPARRQVPQGARHTPRRHPAQTRTLAIRPGIPGQIPRPRELVATSSSAKTPSAPKSPADSPPQSNTPAASHPEPHPNPEYRRPSTPWPPALLRLPEPASTRTATSHPPVARSRQTDHPPTTRIPNTAATAPVPSRSPDRAPLRRTLEIVCRTHVAPALGT